MGPNWSLFGPFRQIKDHEFFRKCSGLKGLEIVVMVFLSSIRIHLVQSAFASTTVNALPFISKWSLENGMKVLLTSRKAILVRR